MSYAHTFDSKKYIVLMEDEEVGRGTATGDQKLHSYQ